LRLRGETAELSDHVLIVDDGKVVFLNILDIVIVLVGREKHETDFRRCAVVRIIPRVLSTDRRQPEGRVAGEKTSD